MEYEIFVSSEQLHYFSVAEQITHHMKLLFGRHFICSQNPHLLVLRIFDRILLKDFICLRLQVVHEGLKSGQKDIN